MIVRLLSSLLITAVLVVSLSRASHSSSDADVMGVAIDAETGATPPIDAVSGATAKIDAVSGATKPEFLTWELVESENLQNLINAHSAAYILSTTNPDGKPYASAIMPEYGKDSTIKFALAYNQTRTNLDRSGSALLTVYSVDCKTGRHIGARILLKQKRAVDSKLMKTKGMRVVTMSIESVKPLVD